MGNTPYTLATQLPLYWQPQAPHSFESAMASNRQLYFAGQAWVLRMYANPTSTPCKDKRIASAGKRG